MRIQEKYRFLLVNLAKGLGWLLLLLIGFVLLRDSLLPNDESGLLKYGNNPWLIFSIYSLSEIIIGIIPPELFMMWSLELSRYRIYVFDVTLLAIISYTAGVIAYIFGRYFNGTVIYRYSRKKYLRKYEAHFTKYGAFLLIVAAITPVPYSAVCALVGAAKYPARKFLYISLVRFARFASYGYLVWQASTI